MRVGRQAVGEFVGTALLLAAVVGSGIMGERLSGGNAAIALLANALATGFALVALIVAFGPRTGAHLNPLVTVAFVIRKEFPGRAMPAYVAAQVMGAIVGVLIAHAMFDLELLQWSSKERSSVGQWLSEIVATAASYSSCCRVTAGVHGLHQSRSEAISPPHTGSRHRLRSPIRP